MIDKQESNGIRDEILALVGIYDFIDDEAGIKDFNDKRILLFRYINL